MRAAGWQSTPVVVNEAVIAAGDPYEVIDPVWWSANFYDDLAACEESLKPFSEPQRLVWAVLWYNSEVHNGGHDQFFSNSTGMVWPDALRGLEEIGRLDLRDVLVQAIGRFPSSPSREQEEREGQMLGVSFDGLDEEYWGVNRAIDLREALMAYIRRQPEAFHFAGEVVKPPRKGT